MAAFPKCPGCDKPLDGSMLSTKVVTVYRYSMDYLAVYCDRCGYTLNLTPKQEMAGIVRKEVAAAIGSKGRV